MCGALPLDKIFSEISFFIQTFNRHSAYFLSIYCDTYIYFLLYIHRFLICEQFKERKIISSFKRPLDMRKIVLRDLHKDSRSTRYIGSFEFYVHFLKAEGANPPNIPSLILAEDHWLI